MVLQTVFRALMRDRANLFQSFLQPTLLLLILTGSLSGSFAGGVSADGPALRHLYLGFDAREFYSVLVLLLTTLVASQYATDFAAQCTGRGSALPALRQHGTGARMWLSIVAATLLFVLAPVAVFLCASAILFGVVWPWTTVSFWLFLAGLASLSVAGGFALGVTSESQGFSDLLISTGVFASALAAGVFFPYPATSRIWGLAPYSPFTWITTRLLRMLQNPQSPPGMHELALWIGATACTGIIIWRLHAQPERQARSPVRRRIQWITRNQASVLCGLGIAVLPVAIWLSGPVAFQPGRGAAGFMYPFAGLATVLLLLLNLLLMAPLVDRSVVLLRSQSFRLSFLATRAGIGTGLILLSVAAASIVWRLSVPDLAYTVAALIVFQLWAVFLMRLVARVFRTRAVYWAVGSSLVLVVGFLGGSLWRPSLLGPVGITASYLLPNGLLLHHQSVSGFLIAIAYCALAGMAGSRTLSDRLQALTHRHIEPAHTRIAQPVVPVEPTTDSDRVHRGMVESLMRRERTRILDEVHDTLGHGITGALWQIRSARGMTTDTAMQETLDRAADGLEQGLARIREYLRDSAPRRARDWSELYESVARFSLCPVDLVLAGDRSRFSPDAIQHFTRTVDELLTNATRYGNPRSIRIELTRTSRLQRLEYREYGRGWGDAGPRMGYGLSTIQALYTDSGGSFHIDETTDAPGIYAIAIIPVQGGSLQ